MTEQVKPTAAQEAELLRLCKPMMDASENVEDYLRAINTRAAYEPILFALLAERDALAKFKAYVHQRLDEAGVPVDPNSPHRAEGCRIGGRLDFVLADRDAARAERDKLVRLRQELVQVIDHVPGDVWIKAISAAGYGPHCPAPAKERTAPC